jgi:hypothetical protein
MIWLMLLKVIIAVFLRIIQILEIQNADILIIKAGGAYVYH